MPKLSDVLSALESIAPRSFAFDWDPVGLQIGDPKAEIRTAAVSMDPSLAAIEFAEACGAQLLLNHHPLLFDPVKRIDGSTPQGAKLLRLAKADIAMVAAHTNWDAAAGGISDKLVDLFGLVDVSSIGDGALKQERKLVVFVPGDALDAVVDAGSRAGKS